MLLGDLSLAEDIYGFESVDLIVSILIVVASAMIFFLFATLVAVMYRQHGIQTFRLESTGREPELTLGRSNRYHCFLR